MKGSLPLPLGKTNIGEKEYRENIDYEEAVEKLDTYKVDLPDVKLDSFLASVDNHMTWLRKNGDTFTWRYTTDPWKIFVAEVLLQQSSGDQVEDMYEKFLRAYDSPYVMHQSDEEEVERHLESIGLNEKKRNTLKRAAETFVSDYGGVTSSEEDLKEIKGVGQYISRATMLFSFGESKSLSDTNIRGFIESEFGIDVTNEEALEIMETITPEDAGIARSLYFWIIDKDRK